MASYPPYRKKAKGNYYCFLLFPCYSLIILFFLNSFINSSSSNSLPVLLDKKRLRTGRRVATNQTGQRTTIPRAEFSALPRELYLERSQMIYINQFADWMMQSGFRLKCCNTVFCIPQCTILLRNGCVFVAFVNEKFPPIPSSFPILIKCLFSFCLSQNSIFVKINVSVVYPSVDIY